MRIHLLFHFLKGDITMWQHDEDQPIKENNDMLDPCLEGCKLVEEDEELCDLLRRFFRESDG